MAVEDDDGEPTVDIEETAPTVDGIEEVEAGPSEPISEPVNEPASDSFVEPVIELFADPSSDPLVEPSIEPFVDPFVDPSVDPLEATKPAPRSRVRLIAFASGRGGTGRSLLAANVAVYLAQAAKKVVAIDADPAGGPLHQLLGAPRPLRGYGEMLRGRVQDFGELISDTPIAGVRLVGGESSIFGSLKTKR